MRVDAELEGPAEDANGLVVILGRPPDALPGDAHGAEAEPVDGKVAADREGAASGRGAKIVCHAVTPPSMDARPLAGRADRREHARRATRRGGDPRHQTGDRRYIDPPFPRMGLPVPLRLRSRTAVGALLLIVSPVVRPTVLAGQTSRDDRAARAMFAELIGINTTHDHGTTHAGRAGAWRDGSSRPDFPPRTS